MKINLIILFASFALFSCSSNTDKKNVNNDKELIQPKYAKFFHYEKDEQNEIVLVVNDADTGNELFRGKKIDNPKIITLSATHIGMLNAIDAVDLLVGTPAFSFIANEKVLRKKSTLIEIKNENELPLEKIFFSKTNLIIHSAYTPELNQQKLLTEKNIICFPNQDWKEISPLARAEWIKAIAFLINTPEKGDVAFKQIEDNYLKLKQEASILPLSEQLMSGNIFGDFWYTPAKGSYQAELFKDAHIQYVYAERDGKTTLAYTLEQIIADNQKTSYWLNPGMNSISELLVNNPKVKNLKVVKDKQVYCYSKNATYYWENSLIFPDKILNDYIQITHPEQKILKDTLYFYQKLN